MSANSAVPANITPTRTAFDLHLLLHVTEVGVPRLLKEVIQRWRENTFTTFGNAQHKLRLG